MSLKRTIRNSAVYLLKKARYYPVKLDTTEKELKEFFCLLNLKLPTVELIRIGGKGDGGYLIPDKLKNIDGVISPGVSDRIQFEKYFIERGVFCVMADPTINNPLPGNSNLTFIKKFVASYASKDTITLEKMIEKCPTKGQNMILQMDIESSEYQTILSLSSQTIKKHFQFLIFEIHQVQLIANKVGLATLTQFFTKILKDFDLVHIHPNNIHPIIKHYEFEIPSALEITFVRKNTLEYIDSEAQLPHVLDSANVSHLPNINLQPYWYKE